MKFAMLWIAVAHLYDAQLEGYCFLIRSTQVCDL